MHGLTRRELEYPLRDHGHQGTDNRPGNRRHQGPGSYRQRSVATPAPDPTGIDITFSTPTMRRSAVPMWQV